MKRTGFILLLLLVPHIFAAGQWDVDSLVYELDYPLDDTTRLRLLGEISNYYRIHNYDTAVYFLEQYVSLAQEEKDIQALAEAYYFLAGALSHLGSINAAIDYFNQSREIYEDLEDSSGVAKVNNGFGRMYLEEREYEKALDHFTQSKDIYEALGEERYLPYLLLNIAIVHDYLGQHEIARGFHLRAHHMLTLAGDSSRVMASALMNLGENYELTNELDKVLEYYEKALALSKKLNIQPRTGDAYHHIARYHLVAGNYQQAKLYLDSAWAISNEQKMMLAMRDQSKLYAEVFEKLGEYRIALYYSQKYTQLYDQLRQQESNKQLERLRLEREVSRVLRESAIELNRVKLTRNFTLGGLLLVFITLAVLYRNFRIKKKANAILAELDELKSRMFSNISHELRTPLTLILDPIEQMMDAGQKKIPGARTLKTMERNTRRILDLVNQMLDLSKLDAGHLKIELSEGKLFHHLRVIVSSSSSLAEKKQVHFITKYPEQELLTWFDMDKLDKIITNLLSNAFKYTPSGGSVSFTASLKESRPKKQDLSRVENWLNVSVHDTGKGIPEEDLPKIFDRFYQAGEKDDPERVGTGIGLALTRELVDLMKGEIRAESKQDHGTHINLSLPLGKKHLKEEEYSLVDQKPGTARPARAPADEESCPEPEDFPGGGEGLPIVLVVDDSEDIRIHIRDNLSGFRVMEAENGEVGLEKALEVLPDLVITDVRMPGMDGIELSKRLKEDERTSHIPLIMLTAKSGVESKLEGLETGADDYLTKPFNSKELDLRVKNLVAQREKLRERYRKEFLLEPSAVSVESADEKFLKKTREIIEKQLSDPDFSVEELGREIALSRMQLFRKIKSLTDQSPSEYIRNLRLKRAAQLIKSDYGNLAEITYEVGFNHPSYFAKCFRELYGVAPSEYARE